MRVQEQMAILEELMERARKNGVENCRIIGAEELRRLEPNVSANAIAALHSPDAGTVTPYEFTIALVENAVSNGVKLRINTEVVAIEGTAGDMTVHTRKVVTPKEGGVAYVVCCCVVVPCCGCGCGCVRGCVRLWLCGCVAVL